MTTRHILFLAAAFCMTAATAMAQAIDPRCRTCGKKIVECPYRGHHSTAPERPAKPATAKRCAVCGLPVSQCPYRGKHPRRQNSGNAHSQPQETAAGGTAAVETPAAPGKNYRIVDSHTVWVYNSEGLQSYLKENKVPSRLKIEGRCGLDGFKALQHSGLHFEELDFGGDFDADHSSDEEDPGRLLVGTFSLQCIDGIDADRLVLPNDEMRSIDWPAARYTVKTLVIGSHVDDIRSDFLYDLEKDNGAGLKDSRLTHIIVDKGNTHYRSENGMLLTADGKTLLAYPAGRTRASASDKDTDILPDGVETIAPHAFWGCMTDFINLNGVKIIETEAFSYSRLRSIVVPPTVQEIGSYAFNHCTELRYVTFRADVQKVPQGIQMFGYCPELYYISFHQTHSKEMFRNLAGRLLFEHFKKWNGMNDSKSNLQLIVPPGMKGKYKKKLSYLYGGKKYNITEQAWYGDK